jgi:hypothetical protein
MSATATLTLTPEVIRGSLGDAIRALPQFVEQDDPAGGVLRPWVRGLPLRLQGVLVTAVRGCDGAPKEDSSKNLSRMIRRAVLNPADSRESLNEGGFFGFSPDKLEASLSDFYHSLDQYPLHYVMHLTHACEVIGYMHPDEAVANFFDLAYLLFCHTFHLRPEPKEAMLARLTEDRIANGTTARNF